MKPSAIKQLLNKSDRWLVAIILTATLALAGVMYGVMKCGDSGTAKTAVVRYDSKIIMRLDMTKDGTYTVQGALGDVTIEIASGRVRVESETSPYHLCSIQGWVSHSDTPIVCLPNKITVTIENGGSSDVDVIVQ